MIPFANTAVTLYHRTCARDEQGKTATVWDRSVIYGCRIFTGRLLNNVGGALVAAVDDTVQLPSRAVVSIGDVIVKGVCDTEVPQNGVAEQLLDSPMIVKEVANNTEGPLPHIAVTVR